MVRKPTQRERQLDGLISKSRLLRGAGFLLCIIGASGLIVGIPLSLLDQEEIGIPAAFAGIFLILTGKIITGDGIEFLEQSFRVFSPRDYTN